MASAFLIVPGSFETRTGGYEYDRQMAAALTARGWSIGVRELDASFPRPTPSALEHAARTFASIPDGRTVIVDGLAFGAMPDIAGRERERLRLVALVHLPLAEAAGLDGEAAARLEGGERRALASARRVVVTGQATVETMIRYGVDPDRIVVVEPGTHRAPIARGSGDGSTVHLLCVATVNAGKGHESLARALAAIEARNWRLTCAGSLERDPAAVARLREVLRAKGLIDRVTLTGDLGPEDLAALYDRADVFVLPTLRETYGMAVADALAHGLPVVSTRTGAIPALVALGGEEAGLLVPPGDTAALASALASVLTDARLRARLAQQARRVRDRLPTWEQAAGKMSASLDG